jgi:hypothetical protein
MNTEANERSSGSVYLDLTKVEMRMETALVSNTEADPKKNIPCVGCSYIVTFQ